MVIRERQDPNNPGPADLQSRLIQIILTHTPTYFLIYDRFARYVFVSPNILKALNLSRSQIIGKNGRDLGFPEEMVLRLETTIKEILEHGEEQIEELTYEINGETLHFEQMLRPYRNKKGQIRLVISTLRNITDRKNIQQALQQSEERYRSLITALQEGIIMQDASGKIIAHNPSAEQIFAIRSDQILGASPLNTQWKITCEDGSPLPYEKFPATLALRTGVSQSNVIIGVQKPDGNLRWLSVNSEPLIHPDESHPYAVVSSLTDITESKSAKDILRDSENRFRALMEFAPAGILLIDESGEIQMVNSAMEDLFGYNRNELLDQPIEFLIPGRFQTSHVKYREEFIQNYDTRTMGSNLSLSARRKDGSEFPVDVGLSTIKTHQRTLVLGYVIDITERKRDENALRQTNEQLRRSNFELERRNHQLTLLSEMGEMLQNCSRSEEAFAVGAEYAKRLFTGQSGAIYRIDPSTNEVLQSAGWGEKAHQEDRFSAEDCWALRRNRAHYFTKDQSGLSCRHIDLEGSKVCESYVCIPLTARGQIFGLFHLCSSEKSVQSGSRELATNVVDNLTLSIYNLTLQEQLREQSIQDPLTGLYNRRYMHPALEREVSRAKRYERRLGLVMFDIDHFKEFNDRFGHRAGDTLLEALGSYLLNNLRNEDIACRYGGEEFLIILPNASAEDSVKLARKISLGIKALHVRHAGQSTRRISISTGISVFPQDGEDSESLLESADKALYRAKQRGRDRIELASGEIDIPPDEFGF